MDENNKCVLKAVLDDLQESFDQISTLIGRLKIVLFVGDSKADNTKTIEEPKESKEEEKVPKNQKKPITEFGKRLEQVRSEVGMTAKELIEYVGFKIKNWNVIIRSSPYGKTKALIESSMLDDKHKRFLLDNLPKPERTFKIEEYNQEKREKENQELSEIVIDFIKGNGKLFQENLQMMCSTNDIMNGKKLSPNDFATDKICEILSKNLNWDLDKVKSVVVVKKDIDYWDNHYQTEEVYNEDFIDLTKKFIYQLKWRVLDIIQELGISAATWNSYKAKKTKMPAKVFDKLINGSIGRQSSGYPMLLEVKFRKYNPEGYAKYLKMVEERKK